MLKIIDSSDAAAWDAAVKAFPNWDVYYLNGYVRSLKAHEKGTSFLVTFSHDGQQLCYPVIQKDIADDPKFHGLLPNHTCYDWETPYGYGGPLTDRTILSPSTQKQFLEELTAYCAEHQIVSQFLRFHPILDNHAALSAVVETRYMRDTIYIDTSSPDVILSNLDSKNRNMIRKAARNGIYCEARPITEYRPFLSLYRVTMQRNHADAYYFFDESYFEDLHRFLGGNTYILYALLDGQPVSAAIFFHANGTAHYHLAGSDPAFRGTAAGNLLLYDAALRACENGDKLLHLGGGLTPDDSLFSFKKQFNKNGRREFWIGRTIFDPDQYQALLKLRAQHESDFDPENHFMIQYRR